MTTETNIKQSMDNMYRWTRHVYDLSRKYFLLGRDRLIENLNPADGENIIEVGCGTARNLIKMARTYPKANFYGLDASDEMLKTARKSLQNHAANTLMLAQGYAQTFNLQDMFGLKKAPDKLVFSYALSIIPPWQESIDHALNVLDKGGEIHIVDFHSMEGQPAWFRALIFWWLELFHVYHKPEILDYLKELEANKKGTLSVEHLYRGYTYLAVFKKT